MESEPAIIAACLDSREAFDVVVRLGAEADLSPNGVELFKHITSYYSKDKKVTCINVDVLLDLIKTRKPLTFEKLATVINGLPESSPSNLIAMLTEQRLKHIGADLTAALANGDSERAATLAAEYKEVQELGVGRDDEEDELFQVYQGVSVTDLTRTLREGADKSMLPNILGDIIFNMMPGDHVIVFGPVNGGKSCVAIQTACDYAYDDFTVLYIGNEDPADRMVLRFVCNLTGETLEEVREDEDYYTEVAKENGYDNIIFKELSPGSVTDVRRLCEKFKPTICIVDQARNLAPEPRKGASDDVQAEVMYQLRMLYKRLKIIGVSLTQAATTDIYGKQIDRKFKLEQSDVFGSRREVAAQADIMIGAGVTEQMKSSFQLYLNVCKNKATGIHDGRMVVIDPFTSTIKGD